MRYDVIIVGAGLVGLATAHKLLLKQQSLKLLVIDKEKKVAAHQSGNNSGVIHSGVYYKPGSLKANNCIAGYKELITFLEENEINYDLCGKVIVATSDDERSALDNIFNRGVANGLKGLRILNREELLELEPNIAGVEAIHVPHAGIVDYGAVARKLQDIIISNGGTIIFNEEVFSIQRENSGVLVETDKRSYVTKQIVTCAGLQSDRIASMTEGRNDLRILPFRGEYYKLKPTKEYLIKNLVYPVPNPDFPFLGVHFTRMINGGVEAGPNAVLAFKREGYKFSQFSLSDNFDTLMWPGFWKLVKKYGKIGIGEMHRSLSKTAFTQALQKLLPEIQENDLIEGGAGVRAQACDRYGNLIDDFNIVKNNNIIHVRNAPSPAATSSLSIGKYIANQILYNE